MTYKEKSIDFFKGVINKTELGYININIDELKEYIQIPKSYSNARIIQRILKPSLMDLRKILTVYKINYTKIIYNKISSLKICFIKDDKYNKIIKENIQLKPKELKEEVKPINTMKPLIKVGGERQKKKPKITNSNNSAITPNLIDNEIKVAIKKKLKKLKKQGKSSGYITKAKAHLKKLKTIQDIENY